MLKVLLLVLALSSVAHAGGRAACRVDTNTAFSIKCNLEQTVFTVGGFEVATGLQFVPTTTLEPLPYTALLYFSNAWWVALEIGAQISKGLWFAFSFGVRW